MSKKQYSRATFWLSVVGVVLGMLAFFVAVLAMVPGWVELIAKLAKVS